MLRSIAALFLVVSLAPAQEFTLDHLFRRPFIWGTTPTQIGWAKHAHVLGFLWNEHGNPFRDLYVYHADSKKLIRLTDLQGLRDPINDNEAERDPRRKTYLPQPGGLASFDLSEDGKSAVFSYRGDLFLISTSGGALERLTKTKGSESDPQFSPDGKKLAFSLGGQIYVRSLDGSLIEQRTDVHAPAALTSYRWSPDGKLLSYSVEPHPERSMPLPLYSGRFVTASPFRRSVAGDPEVSSEWYVTEASGDNPARQLEGGKGIDAGSGQWSPDSKHLLLVSYSLDFKSEEIRTADVNSGKSKVVFQQKDDRWVQISGAGWDQTGKRLWFTSDQSGYQHLYTASSEGGDAKQITRGDWEIHDDPFSNSPEWIGDSIYYSSTAAGTAERQFYRVKTDGAAGPERLSKREGLSVGWMSDDGKTTATLEADMKNPWDLYVNGSRVTHAPQADFEKLPWAQTQFITYPSLKDHKPVAARLLLPPGYASSKTYPAVVYIHGSGIATSVLKQWGSYQELRFVFNNYLASKGFVILEMDYRGSTNYGRDWRTGVYLNMGGPDLEDVLGGVEYLRGLKNIDMKHVGIWGWSYGGFLTAMAMFRSPETFQAGAAFSGVYDWTNYNAGYTGERLTTPAENPEAYQRSSPIHFSNQLQNHLLILHGIADDNVLFQEAVQLSEKLIHEGKPFEEAFYPEENHGFVRDESLRDAFGRAARFFDDHLH